MTTGPNETRCEEVRQWLPWLLDDELAPEQVVEVEAHLPGCSACRVVLEREGQLRLALRRSADRVVAPAALRRRLFEAIELEGRERSPAGRLVPAAVAAAVLVAFLWQGAADPGDASELEEVTVRHAGDLPMDVVAADATQVQRYLSGRLPFAVRVPELDPLAASSEARLGGRVTHFRNREAALIRYELPRGRMSMLVYEDVGTPMPELEPAYRIGNQRVFIKRVRGFTAAQWRSSGLVYSVVSDLPDREVVQILSAAR